MKGIEIIPFPEAVVLTSTVLAWGRFNVSPPKFAAQLLALAPSLLASASSVHKDGTTKVTRFRTGNVEFLLMQALVAFDDDKPIGILCAVLPHEQWKGERAVVNLVGEMRKRRGGLS